MTARWQAPRAVLFAGALSIVAACAGCDGSPASPATTTTTLGAPAHPQSIAAIRARYLAITRPANAAAAKFIDTITTVGSTASRDSVKKITTPAADAVKRSGQQLYALERAAPKQIASDLMAVIVADNTVYQGLIDLMLDWGSRGFNPREWSAAFGSASASANNASNTLRIALGLAPIKSS